MRIIRVDQDESDSKRMLWVAAGAAVGLVAGALLAERLSGRKLTGRTLWRRARSLSGLAISRWQPLLGAALAMKDAWSGRDDDEEADDEGAEDESLDEGFALSSEPADPDAGLDSRVLEAFANDPILAERAVEIEETGDGQIVLHGRVYTPREVAHAVTLARGVPGVTGVKQRLAVRDRR
ncbi:MAG: BON domain-containing protein [Gemmatimonadaceae bacterium]